MSLADTAYQTLALAVDKQVATVTLNRAEVRNAFNETGIAEVTAVFVRLANDPNVRVVVLAANGPAFCAGADLNWMRRMAGYSHAENLADASQLAAMMWAIDLCGKPVIARVQGDAYAGGIGLVAAADIAVAVEGAHFCLSETRIGLIPATISPYVIRAIGPAAARRYFLTAERFSAGEAYRLGLVHEVTTAEALDDTVTGIVRALLAASPHAIGEAKRLIRDVAGKPIDDVLIADTVGRIADIRVCADGREGIASFLEKRKPGWTA